MTKTPKIVREEKQVVRYRGVMAAARYCGCSPANLSLVLHGRRIPGADLARKIRQLGVELPAAAESGR